MQASSTADDPFSSPAGQPSAARSQRGWARSFGAASIVILVLTLFPPLVGATAGSQGHARVNRTASSPRLTAQLLDSRRTSLGALPRLWAVQVSPGRRGWFDRALLKRVNKDGINALILRISTLGRKRAAKRTFDAVRRFASADGLYFVAVLPAGEPHTPAASRAVAACSSGRFSRLRCAVQAGSNGAAARLARKRSATRPFVAVYVKGPRRFSGLTRRSGSLHRRILVIAPLHGSFDSSIWGDAIAQTAASADVNMGIAPQTRQASPAFEQFAALLAGESGSAAGGPGSGDTTSPSTPTGLATSSLTQSSMTLSWSASSDDVGVAGYRLFLNGSEVGTSSSTSYSFAGLACGTSYTLGVAAYDAAGNVSGVATVGGSTSACPDTQPPSTPTGLATSGVGSASVALSWNASTDNVGVTGYRLFLNGIQVGSSSTTSYLFLGLACQTPYALGIAAADAAGNLSSVATIPAQTGACSDTQPPSTPTGLATSSVTQSSMTLSWNASSDNVGVAGYRLFLNGSQVGTSSSTSYSLRGWLAERRTRSGWRPMTRQETCPRWQPFRSRRVRVRIRSRRRRRPGWRRVRCRSRR